MIALLAGIAAAHNPVVVNAGPSDDWCGMFETALAAGDLLLLAPGDYTGPCDLHAKPRGDHTEYTVLAAQNQADRPRMHWDGASDHILSGDGDLLQIAWITFPDVPAGVDAIRLTGGTTLWVYDSVFQNVAGTAVRGTGTIDGLRTTTLDVRGVAGGVGIDVAGAGITAITLEDSLLAGLDVGIRVSASQGTVREDVITATTALDLAGPVVATRNLVVGSSVFGAGTVAESSVLVGAVTAGDGSALYGNTLLTRGAPLTLTPSAILATNAADTALPDGDGNVTCADPSACWRDADALDLYPVDGGPLDGAGVAVDGWLLDDWCGFSRQDPPTAGAIEDLGSPFGPLDPTIFAADFDCGDGRPPASTGGEPDTDVPGETGAPEVTDTGGVPKDGCGCATSRPRSLPLGVLLLAVARRRRGTPR